MKEQNEKQAIEEMVDDLMACHTEFYDNAELYTDYYDMAQNLIAKGYRKQSVVIDEFAKRLKEKMDDLSRMEYNDEPYFLVSKAFIDKIAEEMKGGAG